MLALDYVLSLSLHAMIPVRFVAFSVIIILQLGNIHSNVLQNNSVMVMISPYLVICDIKLVMNSAKC